MDIASKIPNDSQQLLATAGVRATQKNGDVAADDSSRQAVNQRQDDAQSPFVVKDQVQISPQGLLAAVKNQPSSAAEGVATADHATNYSPASVAAAGAAAISGDEAATDSGETVAATPQPAQGADTSGDADGTDEADASSSRSALPNVSNNTDPAKLSDEAKQEIQQLSLRDQEVQVHEAAHAAVGGQYAGAPSLTYETGPDGKRYAVAGEVNIDISEVAGDPQATIDKAEVIRAAALAPAQPSGQDRNVAAKASQMKAKAQAELMAEAAAAGGKMVGNSLMAEQQANVAQTAVSETTAAQFQGAVA